LPGSQHSSLKQVSFFPSKIAFRQQFAPFVFIPQRERQAKEDAFSFLLLSCLGLSFPLFSVS
jgi:hypothetical protein